MIQMGLFAEPVHDARPPAVAVRTSIAAAEAIAEMAPTLRGQVYGWLVVRRAEGGTRHEIAAALDMRLQTVCGRCNELLQQGLIYQTSESRQTSGLGRGKVLRVCGRVEGGQL